MKQTHTPPTPPAMNAAPQNHRDHAVDNGTDITSDSAFDTAFDTALRQHFSSEPEPADGGFTQRVMAVLPPRAARSRTRWHAQAQYAQWAALSIGACAAAALLSGGDGPADFAHGVAAYALIGLLVLWSIPSRFSRG